MKPKESVRMSLSLVIPGKSAEVLRWRSKKLGVSEGELVRYIILAYLADNPPGSILGDHRTQDGVSP